MTIIEVCFSPALGGLELYCLNTARELQRRGHRVHLWLAREGRLATHPLAAVLQPQLFAAPGYFAPLFCRRAADWMAEMGVEAIHLHRSRDLAALAPLSGVPKVLTLQIETTLRKRDPYHRWVYRRVERILTITERMRRLTLEALPVASDQVFALPYGIDAEAFAGQVGDRAAARRKFGFPEDAFVIGLFGRLEPSKGQSVLFSAFAQLRAESHLAQLFIVGDVPPEGGGYDQTLRSFTQKLGIGERVRFLNFQPELASCYAALDVFILASRKEAFGIVLLEAMAAGIPIIATNAGGVPEIIRDGENGLLIPPEDPQALAAALQRLIAQPELCKKLATIGKRVVREQFSLDGHLRQLESHFAAVMKQCSSRSAATLPGME